MGRKVVLILDGAADQPLEELGGKTPLEAAHTPNLDRLAKIGEVGLAETVPPKFTAASDVANLSLLGYNPEGIYTGRGPLEAAAMGVDLAQDEYAFRVNTITIRDDETLADYCAGHITTEEAHQVIETAVPLFKELGGTLYPGIQYRHLMVRKDEGDTPTFAPHDNVGKPLAGLTPDGVLGEIVQRSRELLRDHPVNLARRKQNKNTVDALWPWGQGKSIRLETIKDRYGVEGSLVSAVDLIRGIGVLAGYKILQVEGITGYYDTNYAGKAEAIIEALRSGDEIGIVHVESPDEAGHAKDAVEKVRAIENIDREIVARLINQIPDMAILALPDHPTHVSTGLHGSEAVPYLLADLTSAREGAQGYAERFAVGEPVSATDLMPRLMAL